LLQGRPPSADAALLRQAGHAGSLAQWLADSLAIDGQAAIRDWSAAAAAQLPAGFPAQWAELNGLAYACPTGVSLVRGGQPERLPVDPTDHGLPPAAVSPDGHWLALVDADGTTLTVLELSETAARVSQVVKIPGRQSWPLGWMPDGQLLVAHVPAIQFLFGSEHQFDLLKPENGEITHLGSLTMLPQNWLVEQPAIHSRLAINIAEQSDHPADPVIRPAVLDFGLPLQPQIAGDPGLSQSLSPDGRWLAYLPARVASASQPWPPAHITLFDTLTQQSVQVLISESVVDGRLLHNPTSLTWLPDGSGLAFIVSTGDADTLLMRLTLDLANPTAGADVRVIPTSVSIATIAGISSDSRYLAVAVPAILPVELLVLDLTTDQIAARAALAAGARLGAAWSLTGHQLAVQGPSGLYVIDPATNEQQWIANGNCQPAWYNLSPHP
ncbi:MAG: hypothetical protein ABI847_15695, partial [Anaerolineales bacterium]